MFRKTPGAKLCIPMLAEPAFGINRNAFCAARREMHHSVRHAKSAHWGAWLANHASLQTANPREAAHQLRHQFRGSAPRQHPAAMHHVANNVPRGIQESELLHGWRSHFSSVSRDPSSGFNERHQARVRRRVNRLRRTMMQTRGRFDIPFTEPELIAAFSELESNRSPGADGSPYDAFMVDCPAYRGAILEFLELI